MNRNRDTVRAVRGVASSVGAPLLREVGALGMSPNDPAPTPRTYRPNRGPRISVCPRCGRDDPELVHRPDGAMTYMCFPCRWAKRGREVRLSSWFRVREDGRVRRVS